MLPKSVIFFDDLCVLCSGAVRFLIKIDKNRVLRFSSLQGSFAKEVLKLSQEQSLESVIFLNEGKSYGRAEAVIQILIVLGKPYDLIGSFLKLVPVALINLIYNFVARHRYSIFGKRELCLIPSTKEKELFIP